MENTESKARGQMQPFTKADVGVIRSKLTGRGTTRDLALFETAISTMLRGSDLVRLTVADVTDRDGNVVRTFQARQKKTGKPVPLHLSQAAREALARHIRQHRLTPTSYLFQRDDRAAGNSAAAITDHHVSIARQAWADLAGYTDTTRFSGHSTRRTKAVGDLSRDARY